MTEPTAAAELRARMPGADGLMGAAAPLRLVGDLPADFAEGCIADGPGQLWVLHHTFDVQGLGADRLMVAGQLVGQLMLGVSTSVSDVAMQIANSLLLAAVAVAALGLAGQGATHPSEVAETPLEVSWILDLLTVTGDDQVLDTDIDADSQPWRRDNFRDRFLDSHRDMEPARRINADGDQLWHDAGPSAPSNGELADKGQHQVAGVQGFHFPGMPMIEDEPAAGMANAVFATWILSTSCKEVLEGGVLVTKDLRDHAAVDLTQPSAPGFVIAFQLGEPAAQIDQSNRQPATKHLDQLRISIRLAANPKAVVPDEPARPKMPSQQALLPGAKAIGSKG